MDVGKKYNIAIYGCGLGYNDFSHLLGYYKDIFNIIGIITTEKPVVKKIDGICCFSVDDIDEIIVDYVIVSSSKFFNDICRVLNQYNICSDRIIPSKVFMLPGFDFEEYILLKKKNVSILSNYCLGGFIYSELGLYFNSPTINIICEGLNYLKFLENYKEYMKYDIKPFDNGMEEVIDLGSSDLLRFSPKGILANEIIWNFVHEQDYLSEINKWNKRRKRFNFSDCAVTMIIQNDEEAYRFNNLSFEKKIGFYYKDLKLDSVIYIPGWEKSDNRREVLYRWHVYANNHLVNNKGNIGKINWLRFLNNKDDYIRY